MIKTEKAGSIGKIILNRPETLNIIERETFSQIHAALDEFETDDVKIILITANCGVSKKGKKVFSAGVNLKKYDEKIELAKINPEKFKEDLRTSRSLIERIENFSKPVVIGIDGFVTGGFFELALGCDAILATESAAFSLNEVNIGLIPGYGGIHRLLRLVGKNRTFEIIATGRVLEAQEAYNLGIVTQIVDDFEEYCHKLAGQNRHSEGFIPEESPHPKAISEESRQFQIKGTLAIKLVKNTIERILAGENIEEVELENFTRVSASKEAETLINAFLNR
jgi:enoyl-CoA hydratase/carnithine racemase